MVPRADSLMKMSGIWAYSSRNSIGCRPYRELQHGSARGALAVDLRPPGVATAGIFVSLAEVRQSSRIVSSFQRNDIDYPWLATS